MISAVPTARNATAPSALVGMAETIDGVDRTGTVAVVTGAGGGLGGGIARAFGACGAAVVVHDRTSVESAAKVVTDITATGGRALSAQCDLTEPDSCRGLGNACVFLASWMAEWISGVNLVVDGGVSAHPTW